MKPTDYKRLWSKSKTTILEQHNTLFAYTHLMEQLMKDKIAKQYIMPVIGKWLAKNKDILTKEEGRILALLNKE